MYFEKNLALLEKINPVFAEKIKDTDIDNETIQIIETEKENCLSCKAGCDSHGYKYLIHSSIDPTDEAAEYLDNFSNLDKNAFTIVIGFGFGYHIRELLARRLFKGRVLVIEPRMDIMKAAMTYMDLSDILCDGKLFILAYDNQFKDASYQYLLSNSIYLKNPLYIQLNSYENIIDGGLRKIRQSVNEMILFTIMALGDSPSDTMVGIINAFNSMEYIVNSFNFLSLKDKYKGYPAIIVSAGPSLDKNFKLLKEVKGKALIIAAETINEKLLNNDIVPDIVSVLERGMNVYTDYFQGHKLNPDSVLFGQSVIEHEIFDIYPGKRVVCLKENTIFEKWISEAIGGVNVFSSGTSVANMNFSIARILGCDPIIFIGQDLAYSDEGKSHARGTVSENLNCQEHLKTLMNDDNEAIFKIKGNYSDTVDTNRYWIQFLKWFEMEIGKTASEIINATEGGAYISGTKLMSLREAIDQYCTRYNSDFNFSEMVQPINSFERAARLETLIRSIEKELNDMERLKKTIFQGIESCEAIIKSGKYYPKEINEAFRFIYHVKMYFEKFSPIFSFIVQAPRVVSAQKDAITVNLESFEEIVAWAEEQYEFFNDMIGILDLTQNVFSFGRMKAEAMRDGRGISKLEVDEVLREMGGKRIEVKH